ncbi:MAG: OmpA family protein [Chromatiales bacterium]|nr:MAG: OmpA family protein [Chromatiales bacterium]
MAANTRSSSTTTTTSTTTTKRFWHRTDVRRPWWPWGLLPLLGLLFLYLLGAFVTAPAMEADVRQGVLATLENAGASVDGLTADGQSVTGQLGADGPDEDLLEALAGTTTCNTWAGELECPIEVDLERAQARNVVVEAATAPAAAAVHEEAIAEKVVTEPGVSAVLDDVQAARDACNEALGDALSGSRVQFRTASADIDSTSDALLQRLAVVAEECPGNLTIEGHTDGQGDADMNQVLSQARANAVRDALADLGVDSARMRAVGYGESRPIADNTTAEGRATNRRIAISIDANE